MSKEMQAFAKTYTTAEVDCFVQTIRGNVELFKVGVKDHIQNNIILVVGRSGSGKSSVINMLAGKPIEAFEENGDVRVDVVAKDYAGEIKARGFMPITIGHKADSETEFPNYVRADGQQFWDCPGFGDTRGPVIEISNMYYINHILQPIASLPSAIKFLFVQSHSGTLDGGKLFRESIDSLCKMFPLQNVEALIEASTFVFTKITKSRMKDKYLEDALKRATVTETAENARVVAFLKAMKDKIDQVKYVKIPEATIELDAGAQLGDSLRDEVINYVSHSGYIAENHAIGFAVSDNAHIVGLKLEQFLQDELSTKCIKLIPIMNKVFKQIEKDEGFAVARFQIKSLLKLLETDKEELTDSGGTVISFDVIKQLIPLSDNLTYLQALLGINETLQLIAFIDNIISHQTCGANFTKIIEAVVAGGSDYLSAIDMQEALAAAEQTEKYMQDHSLPTWVAPAAITVASLTAIAGGIAVAILIDAKAGGAMVTAGCTAVTTLAMSSKPKAKKATTAAKSWSDKEEKEDLSADSDSKKDAGAGAALMKALSGVAMDLLSSPHAEEVVSTAVSGVSDMVALGASYTNFDHED